MKKNSMRRVALGLLIGVVLLVGVSWVLILTLGNGARSAYAGKSLSDWRVLTSSPDAAASNKAVAVVNSRVIPELTEAMFHDTNDSKLRIWLIDTLNQVPGVQIVFTEADGRRVCAAAEIAELGPGGKAAIPALLQALKGSDEVVRGPAIAALGEIHSEPDMLIPLLTGYLDDDKLNDEAAKALGNYGALARAAVPKILPMLHAPDKDARAAAAEALQKIDPEGYSNAMRMAQAPVTNGPAAAR